MSGHDVPVHATGRQIELRAGVGPGEPEHGGQGQALVPWPNRLRDGR